jgi:DNA invertase Pin-like site-specific DNA recombinase
MSIYGYARVSTFDQDLSIQRAALKAAGCEVIRAEKASGARRDGRTELQVLLDFLRAGDTLVVIAYRPSGAFPERPAGHRARAQGQGCRLEGD